jgi:glycosyltransferase involved in cell wall biosynthesis
MRIAFLCGGLGLGGVADYTRLLAGALRAHGIESLIIGLADRDASAILRDATAEAPRLILPAALTWRERSAAAQDALDAFAPDWVSLQFVPFAYNAKGVVWREAPWIESLMAGRRAHVMLHELWVEPLPRPVPLRRRVLRSAQRAAILRLLRRIRPEVLHTSNAVYLDLLAAAGLDGRLLPLFGNVPAEPQSDRAWLDEALRAAGIDRARRPLLFGFFGGVAPDWDAAPLLTRLSDAVRSLGRPGVVLSVGFAGGMEERMRAWQREHSGLEFLTLGVQPIARIAAYLQALDFGLTSYPYALIGKSSSVVAMLEHGLPVIVAWGDLRPDLPAIDRELAHLVLRPGGDLRRFISEGRDRGPLGSRLPAAAAAMADALAGKHPAGRGMKGAPLLG